MSDQDKPNMFEVYYRSLKSWTDMTGPLDKSMKIFTGTFQNKSGEENVSFLPFLDWNKGMTDYFETFKRMPLPYEMMMNTNETLTKIIKARKKAYETNFKCLHQAFMDICDIGFHTIRNDDVQTDKFFEIVKDTCYRITDNISGIFEDTPFEKLAEIDQAIKKSMNSFSEERDMINDFVKEASVFMMNMKKRAVSGRKELVELMGNGKEDANISLDSFKQMASEYGAFLKRSMEIINLPDGMLDVYRDAVDGAVHLAEKHTDILASFLEINLKSKKAVSLSARKMLTLTSGAFLNGNGNSKNDFFKEWAAITEKATRDMLEAAQLEQSIPKAIQTCAECFKSTNGHIREVIAKPFSVNQVANA